MKKFIFTIFAILALNPYSHARWWNHDQERIDQLQGQLDWQQKKDDGMGVVVVVLAVGAVAALGIGAAVGSKTRRDATRSNE